MTRTTSAVSEPRRLVLWRGVWHFAETHVGDRGVPFVTLCGREVPSNASVRAWEPTEDVCAGCRRARPLWTRQ